MPSLEALKTVAETSRPFFIEIFDYSMENYSSAKATYHVSASTDKVPDIAEMDSRKLVGLIESNDDLRQILHVNFGGVLTLKKEDGEYYFRDQLLCHLDQNEELHFKNLITHLGRHLEPFKSI